MTATARVIRRDRAATVAALAAIAALAWAALIRMAAGMDGSAGTMAMPHDQAWSLVEAGLLFAMWAVMMVAMMLPSAAPMILLVAAVAQRRQEQRRPAVSTAAFVAGYLLVWVGFSAAAALAQWTLHRAALLSPAMASTSPILGGSLLIAAGVYQWLPLKRACLHHCRSPLGFLGSEWREGRAGMLVMGARHGAFCVGCCAALMALLFVAGVMNLLWVATIAGFVLLEKVAPAGAMIGRVAGVALVAWGIWVLAAG